MCFRSTIRKYIMFPCDDMFTGSVQTVALKKKIKIVKTQIKWYLNYMTKNCARFLVASEQNYHS